MKLPSLDSLVNKSTASFTRFPLAIVASVTCVICMILFTHLPHQQMETHFYYLNVVMSCCLLMLLSIAATVYSERVQMGLTSKALVQLICFAAVAFYFFSLPDHFMAVNIIRFILFSIGLHLLIAFTPFINRGELNGFWQYNKILLLRILTVALYSVVLYLGLSLAILAVDQLFKAHIEGEIYGDLWFIIAGIFNTWFFLAGFPSEYISLESKTDYPKGLKIFTQYVLLPLITIYLLILYAYMFKIIVTSEWPVGWVSYLVLGFSIAGILSLLLIYPVRNDDGNKWILVFSRFFYLALFPLVVLLFFAIKRRISDYGITENRYFVLVLALWLVFIAVYFLASKVKSIKLIPLSLCIVAFLTSFGPWSAFQISLKSQKKHLTEVLEKNKMLSDGKVIKASDNISFDDHHEISSVIEYLVEVHGYQTLQPYFSQNLDSLMQSDSTLTNMNTYGQVNKILGLMNITYVRSYQTKEHSEKYIDYRSEYSRTANISGYDYFISDYYANVYDEKDTVCSTYIVGSKSMIICFDSKKNLVSVDDKEFPPLQFNLPALIDTLKGKNNINTGAVKSEDMTMISENDKIAVKIIFRSIYGEKNDGTIKLTRVKADIMIKLKKEKENEVGERNQ